MASDVGRGSWSLMEFKVEPKTVEFFCVNHNASLQHSFLYDLCCLMYSDCRSHGYITLSNLSKFSLLWKFFMSVLQLQIFLTYARNTVCIYCMDILLFQIFQNMNYARNIVWMYYYSRYFKI